MASLLCWLGSALAGSAPPSAPPELPGLGALYLDVAATTGCKDACFGGLRPLTIGPVGQVLVEPAVAMSQAGYPPVIDGGNALALSATSIFSALPDLELGDPPVNNLTNVLFVTSRTDGRPVRTVPLRRGEGWPAKAMGHELYISQLEWDNATSTLYALLYETGLAPGVEPKWAGYCSIDPTSGAADWVADFPIHETLLMVSAVSGFDSASSTIYSSALTLLLEERVWAFSMKSGSLVGSWGVGGASKNASLMGLAILGGEPPVAVLQPMDPDSKPEAGALTGGPRIASLLPGGNTSTLYDFGPFTEDMMLSATLGGSTGADGSVVMILDDHSLPTPPWAGDKAVLAVFPLGADAPSMRLDLVPTFEPDSVAGLVALPELGAPPQQEREAAPPVPSSFKVMDNFTGAKFFEGFEFFSGKADPTEGYVEYVNKSAAFADGLAAVLSTGQVMMRVDNSSGGAAAARRQLQPKATCYITNYTRCVRCVDTDFWGYNGDGCDLAQGPATTAVDCCEMCHRHGANCTGYTLDQGVCYLKAVDYCTPRPSPPPGPYHTCAGVMPERGQTCPGGPAAKDARRSVRVSSKNTYDVNSFGGSDTILVVADIAHAPTGCAVWPAFWMLGPTWPDDGEIDIIEGWNGVEHSLTTLHTGPQCTQKRVPASTFTGRRAKSSLQPKKDATDCYVHAANQGANQGCGILGPPGSLGESFNSQGGGVYATLLRNPNPTLDKGNSTQESAPLGRGEVATWFWPHGEGGPSAPADLRSGRPSPEGWGEPVALFALGDDCSVNHFAQMSLVFDITLCGQAAGPSFASDCPGRGKGSSSTGQCIVRCLLEMGCWVVAV